MADTKIKKTAKEMAQESIDANKLLLAQARARLNKIKLKEKKEAAGIERKAENQKKYILGAFMFDQMKKEGIEAVSVTYEGKRLADWLTRDSDRALFGLTEGGK